MWIAKFLLEHVPYLPSLISAFFYLLFSALERVRIAHPEKVGFMIEEIKSCQKRLDGRWFLAKDIGDRPCMGEIGIVKFTFDGVAIGRIQDVDMLPKTVRKAQAGNFDKVLAQDIAKRLQLGHC